MTPASPPEASSLYETGKRLLLASGEGAAAAAYFERAALMGFAPAQRVLGVMCLEGGEVAKDLPKAARWLAAAADQGDPQSCFRLALMSAKGEGRPKDWGEAHDLLRRPGADSLPEARELRRRLRTGLSEPYPELSKAVSRLEAVHRATLDRSLGRRVPPLTDGDGSDPAEFRIWLDLNLGRLTATEALERLTERLDAYYRELAANRDVQDPARP